MGWIGPNPVAMRSVHGTAPRVSAPTAQCAEDTGRRGPLAVARRPSAQPQPWSSGPRDSSRCPRPAHSLALTPASEMVSKPHCSLGQPSWQQTVPHGPLPEPGFPWRHGHLLRLGPWTGGAHLGPSLGSVSTAASRGGPSAQVWFLEVRSGVLSDPPPPPSFPHWLQGGQEGTVHPRAPSEDLGRK